MQGDWGYDKDDDDDGNGIVDEGGDDHDKSWNSNVSVDGDDDDDGGISIMMIIDIEITINSCHCHYHNSPWWIFAPCFNNNFTTLTLSFWHASINAVVWSVVAMAFTSALCSNNISTISKYPFSDAIYSWVIT